MRILFLGALLCLAAGAAALAAKDQPTTNPATRPTTQQTAGAPINKFCAVDRDSEVDPKVTIVYEGKTIGFCCADCIKDFNKDPKKYMANLK